MAKNDKTIEEVVNDNLLSVKKSDQYKTVDELIASSQPNAVYSVLLVLSTIIIASGLLLNNSVIVIGGMLATPVLSPILVVALYFSTKEFAAIKDAALLLTKSFGFVIFVSAVMAFVLKTPTTSEFLLFFEDRATTGVLYFIVSLVSGIIATIGVIRKDLSSLIPGVAIAISIVPPLSSVGIWAVAGELGTARIFLVLFLVNLFGLILGSYIFFNFTDFNQASKRVQKRAEEAQAVVEEKKAEKEAERNEKVVEEAARVAAEKAAEKAMEFAAEEAAMEAAKEVLEQNGNGKGRKKKMAAKKKSTKSKKKKTSSKA